MTKLVGFRLTVLAESLFLWDNFSVFLDCRGPRKKAVLKAHGIIQFKAQGLKPTKIGHVDRVTKGDKS